MKTLRSLYEPLDWVLVRAPLLPIERYLALSHEASGNGERTVAGDPEGVPSTALPSDPRIRTALAVGSASLFDALERSGPNCDRDPRSAGKLLRYLIRMSTRPTPYGLFAGVALARWGPETDLSFASAPPRTRTRPDMAWLLRLVFELENVRELRTQLRYVANPLAFVRAGRVFLPEPAPAADAACPGPAVSIRATAVVRRALTLARTPVPHDRLAAELASAPGATAEKVERLIEELWGQTFLLTDLRPPLTGPSPAAYVTRRLQELPAAASALDQVETAVSAMTAWDRMPVEEAAPAYRHLVRVSGGEGDSSAGRSPQVDMALPLGGFHVTEAVAREAARAAELLLRLTPLPSGPPHLVAYRQSFEARYGPEREVGLLELLDPNFGLGPPSMPLQDAAPRTDPRKADLRQEVLYGLAFQALRERRLVIELDEETVSRLETWPPGVASAPRSLDLSFFIVASSAGDVDAGRFQLVVGPNLGAPAAGRNLSRFADLLGEEAKAALREVSRAEVARRPGALWVELVYLPQPLRLANVAVRTHSRPFEIVLGTSPSVTPERVIPLDELVVGIRDSRFSVRWPAAGAEVVACAGHMLNNLHAPDVCRFLDDVRCDGLAQLSPFDWGPAAWLPFLPRIQAGRVVLCPAQWRIDAGVRAELAPDSQATFMAGLSAWRTRWQVPRYVYLTLADNRLLLDLDDEAQAAELRAEVRKLREDAQLQLQEPLPGPDHAWVRGPGGGFVTELVVPLVLCSDDAAFGSLESESPPAVIVSTADRLRPPGSDWLFAKLYCPRVLEDDLLVGPVADFCEQVLSSGAAEDWFFIRYSDPDSHLRLRFRGQPERLIGEVVPELCSWAKELITGELCTRLCFDTYERELERYGGPDGTSAAERVFGADSRAVVDLLRLSRGGLLKMDLTSLAVLTVDDLLAGLGATEAERLEWCRQSVAPNRMAGEQYRQRKGMLRLLLSDPDYKRDQRGGDALDRALAARRKELVEVGHRLHVLAENGQLPQTKSSLLRSYVHLHCNRLMGVDSSAQEQVLGLLVRTRYGLAQAPLALEHL
jgi:thiopeptide-type bacteriocin biosynthesis protein